MSENTSKSEHVGKIADKKSEEFFNERYHDFEGAFTDHELKIGRIFFYEGYRKAVLDKANESGEGKASEVHLNALVRLKTEYDVRQLLEVCPTCNGSKAVAEHSDEHRQRPDLDCSQTGCPIQVKCPDCYGTGMVYKDEIEDKVDEPELDEKLPF